METVSDSQSHASLSDTAGLQPSPRISGRQPKRKAFYDDELNRSSDTRESPKVKVKEKTKPEAKKAIRKCERSGCTASHPICFATATERCAGNGYTSRWYHISPAEHFCNECFEFYYRSHKDGYETFAEWKKEWSANSKTEASIRAFMVDQALPYWVQCTLPACRKWRQLSRDLELTSDFIRRYTCGMSALGVKKEKQTEHCSRLEDERVDHVRTGISLPILPSFLRSSPAAPFLRASYFADRVGMSPCDPLVLQYMKENKEPTSITSYVQPFAALDEPMRAQSFDPSAMTTLEEAEFPGCSRDPVAYLGIRNLVLALWAGNSNEWLTLDRCIPHVICRGIARVRYVEDLNIIIQFLTRHGFINCGLLPLPPGGAFLPPEYNQERVVIVGAGSAGLAAARHLTNMGTKVTVLEGRGRLGGRVSDDSTLGACVGRGAQMILGDINNPFAIICQQAGLKMKTLSNTCHLFNGTGKMVNSEVDRRIDFHFNAMLDIIAEWRKNKEKSSDINLLSKIWEMHNQFVEESQLQFSEEENGILQFHISNLEYACGSCLENVSALYWDQNEAFPQFAGAHMLLNGGLLQILTKMADGLDVRLNTEISKIDYSGEEVILTSATGESWNCTKVIITVPLAVLQSGLVQFEPPLPDHKLKAIACMGKGLIEKVALQFGRKFWQSKLLKSGVFGHLPVKGSDRGLFSVFYDLSTDTQDSYILISHVTGSAVDLIRDKSDQDVVAMCMEVLRTLFTKEEVPEPVNYFVTRWREDKLAQMAYSYLPVGVEGSMYDTMAEEVVGKVHFAGEATSREFPQSVTGAYLSGIREANKILLASAQREPMSS